MKISRMNRGTWGKVRAFFDLDTEEGFTIKGFKIIEGINGLFVSMPSQKGQDEEYYDTIYASADLRQSLNNMAIDYYKNETDVPETFQSNNNKNNEAPEPIETSSTQSESQNAEKDFDDLPF